MPTKELYNIPEKEFYILEKHPEFPNIGDDVTYILEPVNAPDHCPKCHCKQIWKLANKTRFVRDLPSQGNQIGLSINIRRWQCQNCKTTWTDHFKSIADRARVTNRMRTYVAKEALHKTFLDVARDVKLSVEEIRQVFIEYAEEHEKERIVTAPRVLGVDENYLGGRYCGVYTDVERGGILDITEDRYSKSIAKWLKCLPQLDNIEIVTMDMWGPYAKVIQHILPDAQICVDKFHVIKQVNAALDNCRKRLASSCTSEESKYIKKKRWLLLKNKEALDISSQMFLFDMLEGYPQIKEPYLLKEDFRNIYVSETRKEAEEQYDNWRRRAITIPEFELVANTIDKWYDGIFAYFDTKYTNALTESLNSLIKDVNRKGKGYSFDVLRYKMLFNEKAREPAKFKKYKVNVDDKLRRTTGRIDDDSYMYEHIPSVFYFQNKLPMESTVPTIECMEKGECVSIQTLQSLLDKDELIDKLS